MAQTLPIAGDVRPPFEVAAPDGTEYFEILRPVRRTAAAFEAMSLTEIQIEQAIRRAVDPRIRAELSTLLRELRTVRKYMMRELETIAVETAAFATKTIQHNIRATQVRPQRTDRLHNSIQSRPIATGLPTAAVGIASIRALEKGTAVHGLQTGYWASMEFGFTLTPRIVPGYFMPGYEGPDPSQFRQHPVFQQFQYSKGVPALNIVDPIDIPARNFLRGSLDDIWRFRHQRVERTKKVVLDGLNGVAAGTTAATALGAAMRRYRVP